LWQCKELCHGRYLAQCRAHAKCLISRCCHF
jgi:hypothetical protein